MHWVVQMESDRNVPRMKKRELNSKVHTILPVCIVNLGPVEANSSSQHGPHISALVENA